MTQQDYNMYRSIYESADGKQLVEQLENNLKMQTEGLYICDTKFSEYSKGYCKALYDLIKLFKRSAEVRDESSVTNSWV